MLATQKGRSKPSWISWSLWRKLMTPPGMRGGMIPEGRSLAKDTRGRRDLRPRWRWNFDSIVKNAGLGGVVGGACRWNGCRDGNGNSGGRIRGNGTD